MSETLYKYYCLVCSGDIETMKNVVRIRVSAAYMYQDLKELDAETVNELIEKIVVHQAEKVDGKRTQKVEIHYRFIGQVQA